MKRSVWLGEWVWMLTFMLERRARVKVKVAAERADKALARYKKRALG